MEVCIETLCNMVVIEFGQPKIITIMTPDGEETITASAINITLPIGEKWEVKNFSVSKAGINTTITNKIR
jgi:hypothetical protein